MKKIEINDRFGQLVVLSEVPRDQRPSQNGRYYLCQCDCGNTKIVYGHNLKTGNTKSCGCLSRKIASQNNTTDMPIGGKYGKLTILKRAPISHSGLAKWVCECECGNITEVAGVQLRNGKTTSCGCEKYRNLINEKGHRYGNLVVLKYSEGREGGGAIWECQCDCGNIVKVRGEALRSGHARSCGCVKSWKEKEICEALRQAKIDFKTQYTFEDLRTECGGTPKFDFAIFDKEQLLCLIEYQGEQHYNQNSSWYSEDYVARDELKQKYCTEKEIPLLIWDKNTNIPQEIERLQKAEENRSNECWHL